MTVHAQQGPSGSGGGNQNEERFIQAQEVLIVSLKNRKNFSSQDKTLASALDRLENSQLHFKRIDDPLKAESSANRIEVDLTDLASQPVRLEYALQKLIEILAQETSKPIETQALLQKVLLASIKVPKFMTVNQGAWLSGAQGLALDSCRDQIQIYANPITGKLTLRGSSSGECVSEVSVGIIAAAFLQTPYIEFDCRQNIEGKVSCTSDPKSYNFDMLSCVLDKTQNSLVSRIEFQEQDSLKVTYRWCVQDRLSSVQKFELSRSYVPVLPKKDTVTLSQNVAKDFTNNFMLARDILIRSFQKNDKPRAQGSSFVVTHRDLILKELLYSKVEIDLTTHEAFTDLNERTWIETDLCSQCNIRVRPIAFLESLKLSSLNDLMYWISHEIAHHLLSQVSVSESASELGLANLDQETQAQYLAKEIHKYARGQVGMNQLLDLSLGSYYSQKTGCRDQMEITSIDPWLGTVSLAAKTSEGHCRIDGVTMGAQTLLPRYFFDTLKTTFRCGQNDGRLNCLDIQPAQSLVLCPKSLLPSEVFHSDEVISQAQIGGTSVFKVSYIWCLSETKAKTTFAEHANIYSKTDQRIPLSQIERQNQIKLEFSSGGGLYHRFNK